MLAERFAKVTETLNNLKESSIQLIEKATEIMVNTIRSNKKILWCGNGGSLAQAMHFSTELTVKYKDLRPPFPSISLGADPVYLTALSNDLGFEHSFSRMVMALGEEGDLLVALSTSGKSRNVNEAVKTAKELKMKVLYLTGKEKVEVEDLCDVVIHVPSDETAIIQECHQILGHILIENLERKWREG